LKTIIHLAGPVASAILALSEMQPVSGKDFLNALILGVETECRIGSVEVPMTDNQLEAKFADLADGILPPTTIRRVIGACWSIESLPSAGEIARISVSA
jgi:hypothetical protein